MTFVAKHSSYSLLLERLSGQCCTKTCVSTSVSLKCLKCQNVKCFAGYRMRILCLKVGKSVTQGKEFATLLITTPEPPLSVTPAPESPLCKNTFYIMRSFLSARLMGTSLRPGNCKISVHPSLFVMNNKTFESMEFTLNNV